MKTKYLCPSINTAQIRISNLCVDSDPNVNVDLDNPANPERASKRSGFGDDWEEF